MDNNRIDNFDAIYETLLGSALPGCEVPGVPCINGIGTPYWRARQDLTDCCKRLLRQYGLEPKDLITDEDGTNILVLLDEMQREAARGMFEYAIRRANTPVDDSPQGGQPG